MATRSSCAADPADQHYLRQGVNLPERRAPGDTDTALPVTVDEATVMLSAVKLADDRGGDLVVCLCETRCGRPRHLQECPQWDVEVSDGGVEPYHWAVNR